jgi:hypothetical protein
MAAMLASRVHGRTVVEPTSEAGAAPEETPSTGFLPITLALGLFVTGLFVLGIVPGFSCGNEAVEQPSN